MKKLLFGAAAAAAAGWFLKNKDKAAGYARQAKDQVTGEARGPAEERLNDPALARKVESEIFREADAPKGSVSVSAEYGVIYLRGQLDDQETIDALVTKARAVEGVRAVENLLHLPSETAPTS